MHAKKILIVEDEPEIYRRLERIFHEKGMKVLAPAAGGIIAGYDAAEKVVEQEVPDIALLDIQLTRDADGDGIDLGAMLKRRYGIPVLYLSNHPNDRNITRMAAAGQFGFVVKNTLLKSDEQLWTSFKLELARIMQSVITQPPQAGLYLKCSAKINMEDKTPVPWDVNRVKRFFCWDDITVITIDEKKTVLIQEDNSQYGYIINDSLAKIEALLPPWFIRINDHEILNLDKVISYVRTHIYTADPDQSPDNSNENSDKNTLPGRRFTLGKSYKNKLENRLIQLNRKSG